MHRFFRTLSIVPLVGCLGLSLSLAACAGSRYATVKPSASSSLDAYSGPVQADIEAAYGMCLARCEEKTSLGAVTREGCLKGCAELRRDVHLRDRAFASAQECSDALREVDINRDLYIEDFRRWCDKEWEHLHKRKGCYDAASVFYKSLTEASVCGGQSRQPGVYGRSAAVESTQLPASSVAVPPPASPTIAQGVGAAPQAPAAVSPPGGGYLVDTPKYQQGYRSGAKAAPSDTGKPALPAPKRAKTGTGKPAVAKTPAKEAKPVEKDTPAPNAEQSTPMPAPAVPATEPASPSPAPVVAPSAVEKPVAAPAPAQPLAPVAPPKMSDGPTLSVPKEGLAPSAPAGQAAPAVPPAPVLPEVPSASTAPGQNYGGVIPPIPSMLEQPYNAPTVIAPQTEGAPGR